jgi:arginine decarboxylase
VQLAKKHLLESWDVEKSAELYGIRSWGAGYFGVSEDGNVTIQTQSDTQKKLSIPIIDVVKGIKERGLDLPVLLRIENLLDSQLTALNESFRRSIGALKYQNTYRGVFPIKVNQQEQVIDEITYFGRRYHHGLEAGSKAELIAALAILDDPEACLICNGYKDEEFIDLALNSLKTGHNCFLVIERPGELDLILKRSRELDIEPKIGVRLKLSSKVGGNWSESGGDRSIFGLTTAQLIQVVDTLKNQEKLHCLQLLHYHLGSQIPNIRDIRQAVLEASRFYADLVKEGAPMGYFDLGGGLAVDYDGSQTNYMHSMNYSLDEYTYDILEVIMSILDEAEVPHPTVITESGRSTVAYYSVLLANVLDTAKFTSQPVVDIPDIEQLPEQIGNLMQISKDLTVKNVQECFNDAIFYRDEIRQRFKLGQITLRERALGENIFLNTIVEISRTAKEIKRNIPGLEGLDDALSAVYYANFSIFQSLPDSWAIDQVFPIMPIHRLQEEPVQNAVLADITCDCDGVIEQFIDPHDQKSSLLLHDLREDEEYYLGFFLVGAYQETLGDLHNLFGDTNVVSIRLEEGNTFSVVREIEGDTIADVLSIVEYDPKQLLSLFRKKAERAVREGKISVKERMRMVKQFEESLRGYTYYET